MSKRSNASKALLWSAAGAGLFLFAKATAVRMESLRGKVALITGGSRGLGLLLARHLAHEGARIAICARDERELADAKRDLQQMGADVFATPCDLRNRSEVEAMVSRVQDHFGGIDVLINNAGIISVGPLEEMTIEDFEEAMASNFWAAVYTTFAVLPEMRRRRSGRIVNISSIGGKIAVPHLLPYSASKFAVEGFSRGLRSEVLKDGIVVTTVAPGLMRTGSPRNASFKGQNQREYAWFSISDSMPFISMNADRAAEQIIAALKRGEVEITLTMPARIAAAVDALFPEFSGGLLAAANRMLPGPGGIGRQIAKGKDSSSAVAPSVLTAPSDTAAAKNNEIR
jgi:NAD(P)-dependent dehydrogenase (short-subunit alcohol dehydrogenase family)